MKKLILLGIILLFFTSFNSGLCSSATSQYYGKVEQNGVYIYSQPQNKQENRIFEIPNSYFVRLIENANDNFYYCAYKDVYGYVLKNEVNPMNGLPKKPFVESNFRVFAIDGLGLYSKPNASESNKRTTIPYLTDNLTYYGSIVGQELIPDKSSVWIYCKYDYDVNNFGYVYSVFCDKLPQLTTNTERFEIVKKPFDNAGKPKELTSVAMGFIIVGVSLPCLIVLFLLVRPTMMKDKQKLPKKRKNKDYFEFDESDLN